MFIFNRLFGLFIFNRLFELFILNRLFELFIFNRLFELFIFIYFSALCIYIDFTSKSTFLTDTKTEIYCQNTIMLSKQKFTCSKSTTETLEKGVKYLHYCITAETAELNESNGLYRLQQK